MRLALFILSFIAFSQVLLFSNSYKMDRCKPPQFIIATEGVKDGDFILQKTEVSAKISGVIADVTVKQIYENKSSIPLEAIYQFPTSSKAAVYAMQMTIGKRTITAEIKKKNDARQIYETAKSEGKRTSLLEQDRPNLFTMNVANIIPGDIIEVEMKYTEILEPIDKIYSFVYPTVAAPRYSSNSEIPTPENTPNPKNIRPYITNQIEEPTTELYQPQGLFDLSVEVASPFPISEINCSEKSAIIAGSDKLKTVKMQNLTGNGDILVNYRLAGDAVNSGLMLYNDGKENYFMLTIQPPARVTPEIIPPREYIFVLDVSGSMNGFPTVTSKKLMVELIKSLKPTDKFNLILFASGFSVFSEQPVEANRKNLEKVFDFLNSSLTGGGTELLPALNKALEMSKGDGVSRSVVILTDGLVSFERAAFDLVRSKLDKQNVFCFGIGGSVNEYVLKGIAHSGEGESYIVRQSGEATEAARNFIKYISSPIMTDIKVKFNGFATKEVEPKIIPDLFAEKPIVVYGKYDGGKTGYLQISGLTGTGQLIANIDIAQYGYETNNNSLKYLWARNQIRQKYDYLKIGLKDTTIIKDITDLSLKYSLMSDYTSFVAVDNEIAVDKGKDTVGLLENFGNHTVLQNNRSITLPNVITAYACSVGSSAYMANSRRDESRIIFRDDLFFENDRPISYSSRKLNKLIYEYCQKVTTDKFFDGLIRVLVTVNNEGKIINKSILSENIDKNLLLDAYNIIDKIKFKPAYNNGKSITDSVYIDMNFVFPEEFVIKLNNEDYKFEKDKNGYRTSVKLNNSSKKVYNFDNVKIKFKIYQTDGKDVQSGEFEFMQGIGEAQEFIEKTILGLSLGSKALILIDKMKVSYNFNKLPNIDSQLLNSNSLLFEYEIIEIK